MLSNGEIAGVAVLQKTVYNHTDDVKGNRRYNYIQDVQADKGPRFFAAGGVKIVDELFRIVCHSVSPPKQVFDVNRQIGGVNSLMIVPSTLSS